MNAYNALAADYDRLTQDVEYEAIYAYCRQLLELAGAKPQTVVDLACGTGSMSVLLAKDGYSVTGVDMSEEMLTAAWEKAAELDNPPFFVRQKMQRLRLPSPVDWVFCGLDSVNYVLEPADCAETMRRVCQALNPGGVFIFDLDTPEKLRAMDGQVFLDEDDDVYCVWRGEFDEESRICTFGMDLFQRRGKVWHRSQEEHREYAYELAQVEDYLRQAGFDDVRIYGDRTLNPPQAGEQRAYFMAIKR